MNLVTFTEEILIRFCAVFAYINIFIYKYIYVITKTTERTY